jgi:hypothetical protein
MSGFASLAPGTARGRWARSMPQWPRIPSSFGDSITRRPLPLAPLGARQEPLPDRLSRIWYWCAGQRIPASKIKMKRIQARARICEGKCAFVHERFQEESNIVPIPSRANAGSA